MKEIDCDIIQDLLPSYNDKISSKSTNNLVEEHLQNCKNCKRVLENMNKEIQVKTLKNKMERIDYLKGYKKRKKIMIIVSILLTIFILATIFVVNLLNKNILLDRLSYVDVNKFNVEYLYIKENTGKNMSTGETYQYKTIEGYLYSEEYKNMYLTGGYELQQGDTEIYYKIAKKELPKGIEFDGTGLEMSFTIDDTIEKIYIEDMKHNRKEIWNKNRKVQTEEEWKKWYIDSYVPKEIKELYSMDYENIPVHTSIWKHLYNKNLENAKDIKVWSTKK